MSVVCIALDRERAILGVDSAVGDHANAVASKFYYAPNVHAIVAVRGPVAVLTIAAASLVEDAGRQVRRAADVPGFLLHHHVLGPALAALRGAKAEQGARTEIYAIGPHDGAMAVWRMLPECNHEPELWTGRAVIAAPMVPGLESRSGIWPDKPDAMLSALARQAAESNRVQPGSAGGRGTLVYMSIHGLQVQQLGNVPTVEAERHAGVTFPALGLGFDLRVCRGCEAGSPARA